MLTLKVTPKDGDPYYVETSLAVLVASERRFKRSVQDMASSVSLEWLAYLAFECCKEVGITVPAVFDDYLKRIRNVEAVDRDADPTVPVLTAG